MSRLWLPQHSFESPIEICAVRAVVNLSVAVRTDRGDPSRMIRAAVRDAPRVMRLQIQRPVSSQEAR